MTREEGLKALADCRDRIDLLDRRILALINERTCIVEEIGRIKQELALPIYEPRREDEVFRNVALQDPALEGVLRLRGQIPA